VTLPSTPSLDLRGRRALVSGASRGIGRASAAALAAAGAEVVLAARHREQVETVAEELAAAGAKARALVLDVADVDLVQATLSKEPAFDILINSAGINRPAPFTKVSQEDFDAIFGINIRGAFFLAQTVAARMVSERVSGSIINMSSQMGHVGAANRTVYCASKHALEGLTRAMAAELGVYGIRVNSICPTFISTPMTDPFLEDAAFRSSVMSKIKLGRIGTVEDVMGAVVFLASDASALMTGSALMLDGGWTSTS
jgi:NAD(P)-dependent dehydrogenase (short-subunit alcohol dehydrogenase family)